MKNILVLIGALIGVVILGLGLSYGLGWLLSIIVNPILLNFGLNTITPFIGFLIVVTINIIVGLIRK